MISDLMLTIICEDGEQKVPMKEYLTRADFHEKIGLVEDPPVNRRVVFMGTTIATFPYAYLDLNPRKAAIMDEMEEMVRRHPLKYFVPQADWAVDFLNDQDSTFKILLAPNGVGKTVIGWIDMQLGLIENDPSWPLFTLCGVKPRPFRARRMRAGVSVVSYQWENHISTIHPLIQKWTPPEFLGDYAIDGKASVNWKSNPRMEVNGFELWFNSCSQDQAVFESSARAHYWWDEQGEKAKFNGANQRIRRRGGRHTGTLTPHKVEGRPDTGGASFLKKFYTKEISAGLKVKFYEGGLAEVPSYVFSEEEKRNTIREWIEEPIRNNDLKKLREGQARVYGKFQESSGLVFDEWARSIHVIEDIDIQKNWTRYRYVDWGRVEPTACLMVAVNSDGDVIAYDEYFETNLTTSENAARIIEKCGNVRLRQPGDVDRTAGLLRRRYEEVFSSQAFRRTKMDSRSMNKKSDDSALTIGQIFRAAGIVVQPADGTTPYKLIPAAKEYLLLDPERKHIQTGELGAPAFYVIGSRCPNFVREIEQYVNEEIHRKAKTGGVFQSERPKQENDHVMTCFIFMAADRPEYIEGWSEAHIQEITEIKFSEAELAPVDPYTNY